MLLGATSGEHLIGSTFSVIYILLPYIPAKNELFRKSLVKTCQWNCSIYNSKKYFFIWPDSVYILSPNKGVETKRINVVDQKFSQAGTWKIMKYHEIISRRQRWPYRCMFYRIRSRDAVVGKKKDINRSRLKSFILDFWFQSLQNKNKLNI